MIVGAADSWGNLPDTSDERARMKLNLIRQD